MAVLSARKLAEWRAADQLDEEDQAVADATARVGQRMSARRVSRRHGGRRRGRHTR